MTDSPVAPQDRRARLLGALVRVRPRSRRTLWQFVRHAYGLTVPRRPVCPGHAAPMDYLVRAFLEPGRDLVVWACRGGAKTELGSIATHLDSIFRPGCQTRILGGSLDQSEKMYEYLRRKWEGPFRKFLAAEPTARRTELANGSAVEILSQSQRSVRGQRVHRLRCDEVDEFAPEVWRAAQFVTQSAAGGDGQWIAAQMEAFSTMHRPLGPMADLVDGLEAQALQAQAPQAQALEGLGLGPGAGPVLLKWCLWEVIERCPPERACSRCPLWSDCEGRARAAEGYFAIDDAIAQKARASRQAWEAEMLCLRPRADRLVFADFDPAVHVAPAGYDPNLALYRTLDFGYANPFVCLWVQVAGERPAPRRTWASKPTGGALRACAGPDLSGVQVRVLGEYVARERPIAEHARAMAALDRGPVARTFGDPAGWQRSDVTGTGPCQELARLGIRVRTPHAGVLEGVELLRRLLKPRPGGPGLVIHPSCRHLIRALEQYHWAEAGGGRLAEVPAKDGADHPLDALRYLVTALFLARGEVRERRW